MGTRDAVIERAPESVESSGHENPDGQSAIEASGAKAAKASVEGPKLTARARNTIKGRAGAKSGVGSKGEPAVAKGVAVELAAPHPAPSHSEARAVAALERPRIDALFGHASRYPLVTVVAGPGYGKTIAIERFLGHSPRNNMLFGVSPLDSDIPLVWRGFLRCIDGQYPGLAAEAAKRGYPDTAVKRDRFMGLIAEAVESSEPPVTFVVDEYSCLQRLGIGRLFEQFVDSGIKNISLMLVSREKVELDITGLRMGCMFQITEKDLAFTPSEVQELYRLRGVEITMPEAEAVWRRTEGWPLAVNLLAREAPMGVYGARGAAVLGADDAVVAGIAPERLNPGAIADLFEREYFIGYDPDIRLMLIQLSEFPFFTLDIVCAALEILLRLRQREAAGQREAEDQSEAAGQRGAEDQSEAEGQSEAADQSEAEDQSEACPAKAEEAMEALRDNHFVSYDRDARIYRLHGMYKAFLAEKRFLVGDSFGEKLFFVAGESFASIGRMEEAFKLFLRCGRRDKTLETIYKYFTAHCGAPRELASQFEKELAGMPAEMAEQEPAICLLRAVVRLNNIDVDGAQSLLAELMAKAERLASQDFGNGAGGYAVAGSILPVRLDALLAEVNCLLGIVHVIRNDEAFVGYFKRAEEYAACGAPPPALAMTRKPAIVLVGNNNIMMMRGSDPGALARMEAAFHEGLDSLNRYVRGEAVGIAHLFSAEAGYNKLDFSAAKRHAYRALYEAVEAGQHEVACNAWVVLLRVAYIQADNDEMTRQLKELRDYVNEQRLERLRPIYVFAECMYYLRMGDDERMDKWAATYRAELQRTPPILQGRERVVYANYLLHVKRFDEFLAHVDQTEGFFARRGLFLNCLDIHVLCSIYYMLARDEASTVNEFWHAYRLAYGNGIMAAFVICANYGRQLIDIARRAQARQDASGFGAGPDGVSFDVEWLDDIHRKASTFTKRITTMLNSCGVVGEGLPVLANRRSPSKRLSKREKEVLADLAIGRSRQEIADANSISVNTAKSTITSVYNKLGAVNRADAVRIAASLGILDDSP